MDKAVDMLCKFKRLYKKARSMVVILSVVEVSGLRKKINKLTDEVKAKDLELQIIPGLVAETAMPLEETAKLRGVAKKGEATVALLVDLQKGVLTKTVAEILPVAEKVRDVQWEAKMNNCLTERKSSMLTHKEASFDGATNTLNKNVSSARVEFAT